MVFILGIAAAVFLAVGFVLQQRAASHAPVQDMLSIRILLDLIREPMWLLGIGGMIIGQLLGAAALREGDLAIVEPLLAANVLFALPVAAAMHRERMQVRDWGGAGMLAAGLGAFIWAARPSQATDLELSWPNWALSTGLIVVVAALLVAAGKHLPFTREATLLAAAAGCLYGLQDALTRKTLNAHGIVSILTDWPPYLLLAVAVAGLTLAQSAFRAAPLAASLPAITIAEPLTGIAFGAGVYGEGIRLTGWALGVEVGSLACMLLGVWIVTTSPLVAREAAPLPYDEDAREPAETSSRR